MIRTGLALALALPNDPALAGFTLYANAITLQFAITALLPKIQTGYVFAPIEQSFGGQ